MGIISISVDEKTLSEIDSMQNELGFSASEAIRAGAHMLISEAKETARLRGKVDALLLVTHDDKYAKDISELRHKHQKIIKTQVHNCIAGHKCLETFVLSGEAEFVKKMLNDFRTSKKVGFAKLIVP